MIGGFSPYLLAYYVCTTNILISLCVLHRWKIYGRGRWLTERREQIQRRRKGKMTEKEERVYGAGIIGR
jgi:hypothetical protein